MLQNLFYLNNVTISRTAREEKLFHPQAGGTQALTSREMTAIFILSPKTIVLREISFLSQLWRNNIMTGDPNKLPILEILFSTGTNDDEEQISTANLPTLTVVYDGERYSIVEGSELIEMALAESFRNLEQDFYTVLRLAVDLRRVEANSNHS